MGASHVNTIEYHFYNHLKHARRARDQLPTGHAFVYFKDWKVDSGLVKRLKRMVFGDDFLHLFFF